MLEFFPVFLPYFVFVFFVLTFSWLSELFGMVVVVFVVLLRVAGCMETVCS
jgi:hypothetical protein